MRRSMPFQVAMVPGSLTYGAIVAQSEVPNLVGWLAAPLMFGLSAQLAVLSLVEAGVIPLIAVLTACVVNGRHVLYSANMSTPMSHMKRRHRAVAAYLLTDEAHAFAADEVARSHSARVRWVGYLAAAGLMWMITMVCSGVGVFVASGLPSSRALDLMPGICLAAIAAQGSRTAATRTAAAVAAATVAICPILPYNSALLVAIGAGTLAGLAGLANGGRRRCSR